MVLSFIDSVYRQAKCREGSVLRPVQYLPLTAVHLTRKFLDGEPVPMPYVASRRYLWIHFFPLVLASAASARCWSCSFAISSASGYPSVFNPRAVVTTPVFINSGVLFR